MKTLICLLRKCSHNLEDRRRLIHFISRLTCFGPGRDEDSQAQQNESSELSHLHPDDGDVAGGSLAAGPGSNCEGEIWERHHDTEWFQLVLIYWGVSTSRSGVLTPSFMLSFSSGSFRFWTPGTGFRGDPLCFGVSLRSENKKLCWVVFVYLLYLFVIYIIYIQMTHLNNTLLTEMTCWLVNDLMWVI